MLNIGTRLGLGIVVLILLCVIIGLVSYTQTGAVNDKLEDLTEVREPVNSAVYGLENDIAETAFASLAYSATGDPRMYEAIERNIIGQDSGRYVESGSTTLARTAGLRADVREAIDRFHHDAINQVRERDQQVLNMSALLAQLQEIDKLLSDRILRSISVNNPIAYRRLEVALGMQVQMYALAKSLGNYLQTGEARYADQLNTADREFTEFLRLYHVVVLSAEEQKWAEELQRRSNESLSRSKLGTTKASGWSGWKHVDLRSATSVTRRSCGSSGSRIVVPLASRAWTLSSKALPANSALSKSVPSARAQRSAISLLLSFDVTSLTASYIAPRAFLTTSGRPPSS